MRCKGGAHKQACNGRRFWKRPFSKEFGQRCRIILQVDLETELKNASKKADEATEESSKSLDATREVLNAKAQKGVEEVQFNIPLATKLKECGVFGVSSDEYLNYVLENHQSRIHDYRRCLASHHAQASSGCLA